MKSSFHQSRMHMYDYAFSKNVIARRGVKEEVYNYNKNVMVELTNGIDRLYARVMKRDKEE